MNLLPDILDTYNFATIALERIRSNIRMPTGRGWGEEWDIRGGNGAGDLFPIPRPATYKRPPPRPTPLPPREANKNLLYNFIMVKF